MLYSLDFVADIVIKFCADFGDIVKIYQKLMPGLLAINIQMRPFTVIIMSCRVDSKDEKLLTLFRFIFFSVVKKKRIVPAIEQEKL